MFKIVITTLLISGLMTPSFVLAQEAPKTIEEAKSMGIRIFDQLPDSVKKVWQEEALPLWEKLWDWAKPQVEYWWQRFMALLGKEIEKRKPMLKKEFQKEKEELVKELPQTSQSLWERFKEIIEF